MIIVTTIALAVYTLLFIGLVCWQGLRIFRRHMGFFGLVLLFAFLHAMATKPSRPRITWDDYLKDDGSVYTAAGGETNGVQFLWKKTRADLPGSQTLYISKSTNYIHWEDVAVTTVGAYAYTLTLDNATSFYYYVYHTWTPPVPVHTNGVWLGHVIEKAKNSDIDKMVIIHGKLEADGKVIAP